MSKEEEMRFLGLLVLKGRLKKEEVLRCIKAAERLEQKGRPMPLLEIAARLGILSPERREFLRRSGGEEIPPMPGYVLMEKIGEGGTSNVFRYREKKTGRDLAVKVLKPEQAALDSVRRSFLREAKLLIRLNHPNIVKGYRVGTVKGTYVFFMEYIHGDDLQDLLNQDMVFGEDAALYIVLQAARAMEYMRGLGLLHRDIKPGNIMLTRDNTVKLIDLGFASRIGEREGRPSDTTLGTVQYISPEQALGRYDLDIRSDIYSLGATLYQLVVGRLPFSGESDREIMAKQILESLSSPALKERGRISPHMHYFIEKMMAKEREIRYQSPQELIEHIESTIRGKKTLTFRPDLATLEDEGFIETPYHEEDEDEGETPPGFPRDRRKRR